MSRRSPRLASLGYYGSEGNATGSYRDSPIRSPGQGSRHCPVCMTDESPVPATVARAHASSKAMDTPTEAHEHSYDCVEEEIPSDKGWIASLTGAVATSLARLSAFIRDIRITFRWTPAMKKVTLIIIFFLLAFGIDSFRNSRDACLYQDSIGIWYWWPSLFKLRENSGTILPGPTFPQLLSTMSRWVLELLSSQAESSDTILQQPKIEDVIQSLEKKLLERLAEERDRADMCSRKLETLEGKCAGAVTVEDVQRIVQQALSLYQADRIGMADYALESAGGSVIFQHHSPTYQIRAGHFPLFGFPLHYTSEGPRSVIQPEVYPGKCWAFQGSQGFLGISLSYPIYITHVTLEHLPQSLSPSGHINSAPKDFAVYDHGGPELYLEAQCTRPVRVHPQQTPVDHRGISTEIEDKETTWLGTFTYDQNREPIQTFELPIPTKMIHSAVELKIMSNWGHPEYTCVYRFRVHGGPTKFRGTNSSRTERANTTDTEFHSLL